MTPGARLAAAIELLDGIERDGRGADRYMASFFRARRYMGSGDRAAVRERAYGVMRGRARLDWWLARAGSAANARTRVLADVAFALDGANPGAAAQLFSGLGHSPSSLSAVEAAMLGVIAGQALDHSEQDSATRAEVPAWLWPQLAHLGADELAALNRPAPVDLRTNALKTTRAHALGTLAASGVNAEATSLSHLGLRLHRPIRLESLPAYKEGLVEVQDEGSQLAALLVGARPGMTVIDWCAGAGGKTLALASDMAMGAGATASRLVACDASEARLAALAPRAARAGVANIEICVPAESCALAADRVLVDAPCSGSGTWRRHPEAKWRLTSEYLADYVARQDRILAVAAERVRPGGRLVFVTCSVLAAEGEARIGDFLAAHADFFPVPAAENWAQTLGTKAPEGIGGDTLRLTPGRHGTDGFFISAMERRP
ncbi:MAG: RsmB/NOP family class I SAM-dependent RNA methyltransferase [Alphaproteobacteria bacterium]